MYKKIEMPIFAKCKAIEERTGKSFPYRFYFAAASETELIDALKVMILRELKRAGYFSDKASVSLKSGYRNAESGNAERVEAEARKSALWDARTIEDRQKAKRAIKKLYDEQWDNIAFHTDGEQWENAPAVDKKMFIGRESIHYCFDRLYGKGKNYWYAFTEELEECAREAWIITASDPFLNADLPFRIALCNIALRGLAERAKYYKRSYKDTDSYTGAEAEAENAFYKNNGFPNPENAVLAKEARAEVLYMLQLMLDESRADIRTKEAIKEYVLSYWDEKKTVETCAENHGVHVNSVIRALSKMRKAYAEEKALLDEKWRFISLKNRADKTPKIRIATFYVRQKTHDTDWIKIRNESHARAMLAYRAEVAEAEAEAEAITAEARKTENAEDRKRAEAEVKAITRKRAEARKAEARKAEAFRKSVFWESRLSGWETSTGKAEARKLYEKYRAEAEA